MSGEQSAVPVPSAPGEVGQAATAEARASGKALAAPGPQNPGLNALRRQYGRQASQEDLELYAAAAAHLGLSIPAGEIALVPYGDVNNIQVTIEGRRTIAQRTGRLRGIQGPEWCGPRRYTPDGVKLPLDWEEVWTGTGLPYAARCFVLVEGWDTPANGTVRWVEFHQDRNPVWTKYPTHMLGNAAEKLALRRGFSAEIGRALTDLAEITGDYRTVDEETGELEDPPTAAVPPPRAPGSAVPAGKAPLPAGRRDQPPVELYDNLPEARGWR